MEDNYVKINKRFSPFQHYMFIDTFPYQADKCFIANRLRVYFGPTWQRPGDKYVFVVCKVLKRNKQEFEDCMRKFRNNMLLCGYSDYDAYCNKIMKELFALKEERLNNENFCRIFRSFSRNRNKT